MSFFSKLFSKKSPVPEEKPPLFIVGLGNPGQKYTLTRHNVGFLAVDHLQQAWGGSEWRDEKKFQAEISEAVFSGRKVYLVKPQAFMNHSGTPVRTLLNFYKATPGELIVLHDEVDIPFGKIKATLSSRAAGHNGVKDLIEELGTQDFCRLRLGVGRSANPHLSTADHVLQNFSEAEFKALPPLFQEIETLLKAEITK